MNRSGAPQRVLVYRFARTVLLVILRCLFPFRVVDEHYLPATGPALLVSNHVHNFDPPIVGLSTRRFVYFMAKEELFRWRWFGTLVRKLGAFPVKRGAGDLAAMRQAIQIPKSGGCLVVFPEGHRSKDGHLGKGQPGAAFIARRAGCPIVPVVIIGPYRLFRPLTIRYGPAIVQSDDDSNESLMAKVMTALEQLLAAGHENR